MCVAIEMLFTLLSLCFFLVNVDAHRECQPFPELFSDFNLKINPEMVRDEGITNEACYEAMDEGRYEADFALITEMDFRNQPALSTTKDKVQKGLKSFSSFQIDEVRKLPNGSKFGCSSVDKTETVKVVCFYDKPRHKS